MIAAGFDLASAPAFAADAQAAAARQRNEAFRQNQARVILEAARDVAGVEIAGNYRWRSINTGAGYCIAILHRSSDPLTAEADLTLIARRFHFTWRRIADLAEWIAFDLGVKRLLAHIPAGDFPVESLAQRAGFRMSHQERATAGRLVNVWAIAPEDLFLIGFRGAR